MDNLFMLDTDICSYIIRERPLELKKSFLKHSNNTLCISIITYAELLYGLEKKPSDELAHDIEEFASLVNVIEWNHAAAREYAKIRHYLTSRGNVISALDMQIAAAAIAIKARLVTNNKKHFGIVPNLIINDWI